MTRRTGETVLSTLLRVAAAMAVFGFAPAASPAAEPLGFNIVVALDRSESITPAEAAAQIDGLRFAFADRRLRQAIEDGGGIGLAVLCWSSFARVETVVDWTVLRDDGDLDALLVALAETGGRIYPEFHGSQTDLALGMQAARAMLGRAPEPARRRIVNLVADDFSNIGVLPEVARGLLVDDGITVNGLAMARGKGIRPLTEYFERRVIGGPLAFVHGVDEAAPYRDAMLRKFVLEIARVDLLPAP